MNICIVQPSADQVTETFIAAHAEKLPAQITIVHDLFDPRIAGNQILSQSTFARAKRKIYRIIKKRSWDWEVTAAYLAAFEISQAKAVLAQYGPTGVNVMEACKIAGIPLIVHFHGYDASVHEVLAAHEAGYKSLFAQAAAVITVSRKMKNQLIALGAPPEKVFYNPCGVDCDSFNGGYPRESDPVFLSVGRFGEKKAPYLTLIAFAEVYRHLRESRLRMIGDGPLLGVCRDLATVMGIEKAVTFLGARSHGFVQKEMSRARVFVQHSIEASNGDCEGMPVAILEASASGLPVVATRHAGIPDAIEEEQTGLLCDERDTETMARHMLRLGQDPDLAHRLGMAGREKMRREFSMERSIENLFRIIQTCVNKQASTRT